MLSDFQVKQVWLQGTKHSHRTSDLSSRTAPIGYRIGQAHHLPLSPLIHARFLLIKKECEKQTHKKAGDPQVVTCKCSIYFSEKKKQTKTNKPEKSMTVPSNCT